LSKTIYTILFLGLALFANTQSPSEVRSLLLRGNFRDLKECFDSVHVKQGDDLSDNSFDDILPGYQQTVFTFYHKTQTTGQRYLLELLKQGEQIFYYRLNEYRIDSSNPRRPSLFPKLIDSFKRESVYSRFDSLFTRLYGVRIDENRLFSDVVFSEECGMGSERTKSSERLEEAIRMDERKYILDLLRAPSSEMQLFGYKGLRLLQLLGRTLTKEEQRLARIIRHKKGSVITCSGCLMTRKPIAQAIAEMDMMDIDETYYRGLKNYDWINWSLGIFSVIAFIVFSLIKWRIKTP